MVHLEVDQNITPVVAPPRRVPASLKGQLKQELDRLQEIGVITPVDEPTQWVSGLAVAVKKTGALRICLDPRPLNTALRRERYQLPVLEDILPELSEARIFSTVDLKSGYWHCVLARECGALATFATPYGSHFKSRREPGEATAKMSRLRHSSECRQDETAPERGSLHGSPVIE